MEGEDYCLHPLKEQVLLQWEDPFWGSLPQTTEALW